MLPTQRRLADPRFLIPALIVFALVLRLPNLDQTVWFDEACMARQRLGTFGQMFTTLYVDNHPPLYVVFMYAWVSLFGDGEVVMRLPSLALGLASIPLTYAVGKRLLNERIGLMAALLMCISPVQIWYSIEARLYAPILFLALLAVWLLHRLLDGGKRRDWIGFVALLAIMPLVHYYLTVFLVLFAFLGLLAGKLGSSRATGKRILLWSSLMTGGILLFVAVKFSLAEFNTSLGYMGDLTVPELYALFFQWAWTGNASAGGVLTDGTQSALVGSAGWVFWVCMQVLGVALFARGLARVRSLASERPETWCVLLYLFCLPLFLSLLPWIGMGGTYISRSILPFTPFFFMVLAAGLDSLPGPRVRNGISAAVLALLVVNLGVYYSRPDSWTVYKPHQDWREAAAYLTGELDDGAAGRPVFTTMPNQRSLSYYDPRIQTRTNLQPTMHKVASARASFEARLGKGLGGFVADLATDMAEDVEATRLELLAGTELLVHPLRQGELETVTQQLDHRDGEDETFYILHNLWNPPDDRATPRLLANEDLELIDKRVFRGIEIYKMRLAP